MKHQALTSYKAVDLVQSEGETLLCLETCVNGGRELGSASIVRFLETEGVLKLLFPLAMQAGPRLGYRYAVFYTVAADEGVSVS